MLPYFKSDFFFSCGKVFYELLAITNATHTHTKNIISTQEKEFMFFEFFPSLVFCTLYSIVNFLGLHIFSLSFDQLPLTCLSRAFVTLAFGIKENLPSFLQIAATCLSCDVRER